MLMIVNYTFPNHSQVALLWHSPWVLCHQGHTWTLSCQLPTNAEGMALWYLKMSHFRDLSFFQECVFASSLGLLYDLRSSWQALTEPAEHWRVPLLYQLGGEASLAIQELLYDSEGKTMTVTGTAAWSRWQNGNQFPPNSLGTFPTSL